ncbi:hypothetical protein J7T55_014282 [Diaporthe amygdali]|uniref:uncharacterized protein n=1 Tax=Phomopsis amygdali TaxID=1214568 RepID=UPI0022FDCE34|nr:uncharacterized protein J7T55_014282 [Diaporthe amygdali]KAJ0100689.1 hypothetical protein J7T55_014282 [Diaporthe amygdali]
MARKSVPSRSPNNSSVPEDKTTINHFPHLHPYADPTTGLLSRVPSSWIPYCQLMRLDRPGGLYAFYFPYLIGLAFAACIAPTPPSVAKLLAVMLEFLPLSVLLRGAACTWNDTVDQDFDRRVERCRHRPVARGAISTTKASLFTLAQILGLYAIVSTLPSACMAHVAFATILFFIYALMKRVTYYPQVVLGFPFAWSIFVSIGALGMTPLDEHYIKATIALCAANVFWTITYDTIYAHQDIEDDEKAGVKGMALRFRHTTKTLASVLSIAQVACLALCGVFADFGIHYFVGTVGGVAFSMTYFIYDVDLQNPESCGSWFRDQFIVGAGFLSGLISEYTMKLIL